MKGAFGLADGLTDGCAGPKIVDEIDNSDIKNDSDTMNKEVNEEEPVVDVVNVIEENDDQDAMSAHLKAEMDTQEAKRLKAEAKGADKKAKKSKKEAKKSRQGGDTSKRIKENSKRIEENTRKIEEYTKTIEEHSKGDNEERKSSEEKHVSKRSILMVSAILIVLIGLVLLMIYVASRSSSSLPTIEFQKILLNKEVDKATAIGLYETDRIVSMAESSIKWIEVGLVAVGIVSTLLLGGFVLFNYFSNKDLKEDIIKHKEDNESHIETEFENFKAMINKYAEGSKETNEIIHRIKDLFEIKAQIYSNKMLIGAGNINGVKENLNSIEKNLTNLKSQLRKKVASDAVQSNKTSSKKKKKVENSFTKLYRECLFELSAVQVMIGGYHRKRSGIEAEVKANLKNAIGYYKKAEESLNKIEINNYSDDYTKEEEHKNLELDKIIGKLIFCYKVLYCRLLDDKDNNKDVTGYYEKAINYFEIIDKRDENEYTIRAKLDYADLLLYKYENELPKEKIGKQDSGELRDMIRVTKQDHGWQSLCNMGRLDALQEGKFEDAEKAFKSAIDVYNKDRNYEFSWPEYNLALLYKNNGNISQSAFQFEKIQKEITQNETDSYIHKWSNIVEHLIELYMVTSNTEKIERCIKLIDEDTNISNDIKTKLKEFYDIHESISNDEYTLKYLEQYLLQNNMKDSKFVEKFMKDKKRNETINIIDIRENLEEMLKKKIDDKSSLANLVNFISLVEGKENIDDIVEDFKQLISAMTEYFTEDQSKYSLKDYSWIFIDLASIMSHPELGECSVGVYKNVNGFVESENEENPLLNSSNLLYSLGLAQEKNTDFNAVEGFKEAFETEYSGSKVDVDFLESLEKAVGKVIKKYDDAERSYDAAVEISKDNERVGIRLAYLKEKVGSFDDSYSKLSEQINAFPESYRAYKRRGDLLREFGRYEEAKRDYYKAIELGEMKGSQRCLARTYNRLGIIYDVNSEYDEAIKHFIKSKSVSEGRNGERSAEASANWPLMNIYEILKDKVYSDTSMRNIQKSIKEKHDGSDGSKSCAEETMNGILDKIIKKEIRNRPADFINKAHCYKEKFLKKLTDADSENRAEIVRSVLDRSKGWIGQNDGGVECGAKPLCPCIKDGSMAIRNYHYASYFHDNFAESQYYLAKFLLELCLYSCNPRIVIGQTAKILTKGAVSTLSKSPRESYFRSLCWRSLYYVICKFPNYLSESKYRINDKLLKMFKDKTAACAEECLKVNPNHIPARMVLGVVDEINSNYDRAITEYSNILEINPNHDMSFKQRGDVYRTLGNLSYALDDYKSAYEINRKNFQASLRRGETYFMLGQFENAMNNWTNIDNDDSNVFVSKYIEMKEGKTPALNYFNELKGKNMKSAEYYSRMLELCPDKYVQEGIEIEQLELNYQNGSSAIINAYWCYLNSYIDDESMRKAIKKANKAKEDSEEKISEVDNVIEYIKLIFEMLKNFTLQGSRLNEFSILRFVNELIISEKVENTVKKEIREWLEKRGEDLDAEEKPFDRQKLFTRLQNRILSGKDDGLDFNKVFASYYRDRCLSLSEIFELALITAKMGEIENSLKFIAIYCDKFHETLEGYLLKSYLYMKLNEREPKDKGSDYRKLAKDNLRLIFEKDMFINGERISVETKEKILDNHEELYKMTRVYYDLIS